MKLYAVISPLCMLFSQGIMPAQAQQLAGGKVQVESVLARKNGNRMDVAFRMNLNDLKMKSEQQIVFTPVMVELILSLSTLSSFRVETRL